MWQWQWLGKGPAKFMTVTAVASQLSSTHLIVKMYVDQASLTFESLSSYIVSVSPAMCEL